MNSPALPERLPPGLGKKLDMAALAVVVGLLCLAVLYPETFLAGGLQIGSRHVLIATLVMPGVAVFMAIYLLARYPQLRLKRVDLVLLMFSGYILVRNIYGGNEVSTILSIVYGAGIYFMVALQAINIRHLQIIILVIVVLTIVISAYGVIEYALGQNPLFQDQLSQSIPEPPQGVHRAGSTLAHPVSFAAFLLQVMPFCGLVAYLGKTKLQRLAGIGSLLLAALALLLTFSKGSWIVAMLFAAAGSYLLIRRLGKRRALLIFAVMAIATIVVALYFRHEIYSETTWRTGHDVEMRLTLWDAAISGISDHFIFGVGFGHAKEALTGYLTPYWLHFLPKPVVDNNYLHIFLEEGILGLALWLGFLLTLVAAAIRLIKESPIVRPLIACVLISILTISINGLTFEAMLIFPNSIMFWIAAGLLRGSMIGGKEFERDMALLSPTRETV